MKTTIETNQLHALTDAQYSFLSGYANPDGAHFQELESADIDITFLLQFLQDSELVVGFHLYFLKGENNVWGIELRIADEVKQYKEKECIDALWLATVDVLLHTAAQK